MDSVMERQISGTRRLKFSDIAEPRLLCLIVFNGGGSKLYQSYMDGHPEVYNIPAYPMIYFYPHWRTWQEEYRELWNWDTVINLFCIKHASVIDSRKIVGLNGLDSLGEDKNEYTAVDADEFRSYLKQLLRDEPVSRKTFLLAVNYAYAMCKGQDIYSKKLLIWHHHVIFNIDEFVSDFPDACIIGTIRDPRAKIYGIYEQFLRTDRIKLNQTDAMINRSYAFFHTNMHMLVRQHLLRRYVPFEKVLFLRHEDLASDLPAVMHKTSERFGIQYLDLMLESTFDGKVWWGHEAHDMPKVETEGAKKELAKKVSQRALDRVLSKSWKSKRPAREIFVFEGLLFDFMKRCGYDPEYFTKDSFFQRLRLLFEILIPFRLEILDTAFYLNPRTHADVIGAAWKEATDSTQRIYYGFNATYRYKYTYKDFRYWKRPSFERILDRGYDEKSGPFYAAAVLLYLSYVYARFLAAIAFLPVQYLRRVAVYYWVLYRRITIGSFIAPMF